MTEPVPKPKWTDADLFAALTQAFAAGGRHRLVSVHEDDYDEELEDDAIGYAMVWQAKESPE